ncbi:MAG: redox-sensing transcriptional repressor Rex, partial [Thermoanaerobaculia bacterium]|nr:redox-sensing transcriptional repressor Rex [Thermoanaerobaculia bacterium]
KDLAYFGELGIRGVGYDVSSLKEHLIRTLGIDRTRAVIIAGAGNLGRALANYPGFQQDGFEIVAMLDSNPEKVGTSLREHLTIRSIEEIEKIVDDHDVEIGVLAVPAEAAQAVYDRMVEAGIRSIMNFAPAQIDERPEVKLKTVDLRVCLECLSFHLARQGGEDA